jgi:hypothetical protein
MLWVPCDTARHLSPSIRYRTLQLLCGNNSLLTSKCDTLEALELADRLFDACPRLVKCFWKEGGHVFGVGSIRDCRAYSALACGSAVGFGIVALITERGARIDIGADVEKRLEVAAIAGLTTGEMKASRSRRGDNRF